MNREEALKRIGDERDRIGPDLDLNDPRTLGWLIQDMVYVAQSLNGPEPAPNLIRIAALALAGLEAMTPDPSEEKS